VNALISVIAGAFAAHALRDRIAPQMLATFETGARYQMYHALGLVAVAIAVTQRRAANLIGGLMLAGIILFSGSLYPLSLSADGRFGAITPLGGFCFLAGWAGFALSLARRHPPDGA